MSYTIFTVGHSNHPIERLLELLALHAIDVVADVRSQPYSRRFPDYSQKALRAHLATARVRYAFFGDALGARPDDPSCYTNGAVDFSKLRMSDPFIQAIKRIYEGAGRLRICLLCAEKDPAQCHRAILIGQAAYQEEKPVSHILADGTLESHVDLLSRISGPAAQSAGLFGTDDLFAAALRRQEQRIVYQPDDGENEE